MLVSVNLNCKQVGNRCIHDDKAMYLAVAEQSLARAVHVRCGQAAQRVIQLILLSRENTNENQSWMTCRGVQSLTWNANGTNLVEKIRTKFNTVLSANYAYWRENTFVNKLITDFVLITKHLTEHLLTPDPYGATLWTCSQFHSNFWRRIRFLSSRAVRSVATWSKILSKLWVFFTKKLTKSTFWNPNIEKF